MGREGSACRQALVMEVENPELFLYPGSGHLFGDSSLGDYDEEAALLMERHAGVPTAGRLAGDLNRGCPRAR